MSQGEAAPSTRQEPGGFVASISAILLPFGYSFAPSTDYGEKHRAFLDPSPGAGVSLGGGGAHLGAGGALRFSSLVATRDYFLDLGPYLRLQSRRRRADLFVDFRAGFSIVRYGVYGIAPRHETTYGFHMEAEGGVIIGTGHSRLLLALGVLVRQFANYATYDRVSTTRLTTLQPIFQIGVVFGG